MPGPSRSASLGSKESLEQDLHHVRFHGGFLTCPDSDLDGTVALLRTEGLDYGDMASHAKMLHLEVGRTFFAETLPNRGPSDRLQIAAEVIEAGMYGTELPDSPIPVLREKVSVRRSTRPTTLIDYENKLFAVLAGLVWQEISFLGSEVESEVRELTEEGRRLLRRTQRKLENFIESAEMALEDDADPRVSLIALWDYCSFFGCLLDELEAGAEGPILVLKLDEPPGGHERLAYLPGGPSEIWADDYEAEQYFRWLLDNPIPNYRILRLHWIESCHRLTRSVERLDPDAIAGAINALPAGEELLEHWRGIFASHDDKCNEDFDPHQFWDTCCAHALLWITRRLDDVLTMALDFGSRGAFEQEERGA
jgi:hypothetical protein